MTTKYGECTIIYNQEQSIITRLLVWLKDEEHAQKNCNYIFLFDDGEICEYDDKIINFNFKFCNSLLSTMPLYFEKNINKETKKQVYFYKETTHNCLLDFNQLFSLYSKYDYRLNITSGYNGIYYCHKNSLKPEIFGLIRIKSNEYMPRFQFAYDSDEFTKEEIVYLIYTIFNPMYLQNEIP